MNFRAIKYTCMISFWLSLIFGFLFFPTVFNLFKEKKSINLFMWAGIIDPKFFDEFETKTGIKVYANYFESNEELLVKMLATRGKGYDLIVPSDYIVEFLRKNDLLKKINKTKLNFLDKLNPKLLGHYFDPNNDFTLPSEWYLLGIAINKKDFENKKFDPSFGMLFDENLMQNKIGLINDCRELTSLASFYLFGDNVILDEEKIKKIENVLINQRKYVTAYTDFCASSLLKSGNCSIVLIGNSLIWHLLQEDDRFDFFIPKEGAFLGIENYAIPITSQKEDMVYKFINFIFKPEVQQYNFENHALLSSRKDAEYMYNIDVLKSSFEYMHPDSKKNVIIFHNVLSDEKMNDIWFSIKGKNFN